MKRKILLPTDFSDNAWNAIIYALKLFKHEFCTFYLLNSTFIQISTLSYFSNKLLKSIEQDALKSLMDLEELAESTNANCNHDFQIILSQENLNTALKKAILEWDIDLVIMGTKGATGAREVFFGSNTIHVINNLKNCPVLIVPETYDFLVPVQIAFPTDYNRFYSDKELRPIKLLADLYDAKIRIMHINAEENLNDIQEYNLNKLKQYLDHYDYSFHWMPKYGNKEMEINDFIRELDINILAMVNYKHNFMEKITHEPVIKKIGYHCKIPFMVIPE
ncbi:universal stress protein [Aestuariivivens sediminis]|uniref:universal stress protein n=1 Tax=Aestuariivivens sediminis TaxID=2913557 RepID=UPI001F5A91D4|nr:universal stress protein [Aestuariivivens sediminis]